MQIIAELLDLAIAAIAKKAIPVYTFALYHDRESSLLSVCVDTAANSKKVVAGINQYNASHFAAAIKTGDLRNAALWQANLGRSLALGDFSAVNLVSVGLNDVPVDDGFYVAMIRETLRLRDTIRRLTTDPSDLVFVCSGPRDEVEYAWF